MGKSMHFLRPKRRTNPTLWGGGGGAHTYMAYIWEYRRVEYKENSFLMVIFWFALMFFDYILMISETSI